MQIKLTEKHKIMAYILNKEFAYSQSAIAELMKVSQGTISSAVKEAGYWKKINYLENVYEIAKRELERNGLIAPPNKPIIPRGYIYGSEEDEEYEEEKPKSKKVRVRVEQVKNTDNEW